MKLKNKQVFNLYKFGRYGYYHITSEKFNNLPDAINGFGKCIKCLKIKNILFYSYKITGI